MKIREYIINYYIFLWISVLRSLDSSWPEARQPGCKRTMNGDHGTRSRDGPVGPWERSITVQGSMGVQGSTGVPDTYGVLRSLLLYKQRAFLS